MSGMTVRGSQAASTTPMSGCQSVASGEAGDAPGVPVVSRSPAVMRYAATAGCQAVSASQLRSVRSPGCWRRSAGMSAR